MGRMVAHGDPALAGQSKLLSRRSLLSALFAVGTVTGAAAVLAPVTLSKADSQTYSGRSISIIPPHRGPQQKRRAKRRRHPREQIR
jgi:hypothetical protein